MKKILSIVLLAAMLLSTLVACNSGNSGNGETSGNGDVLTSLPDGMSGSDAARLLLAGERLNAQILKNEGNIFENGVEVMIFPE